MNMKTIRFIIYINLINIILSFNDILELGKSNSYTIGYAIFNSVNIKEGESLNFEIKSSSFINNFINYYYLDNIENEDDISNKNSEELYKVYFSSNSNEKKDETYKIYNFAIIKSNSEYENIQGKYLVLIYYAKDNLAEITSIQKETEEEKKDEKDYDIYIYGACGFVILFIFIYWYCFKKKKNNSVENNNIYPEPVKNQPNYDIMPPTIQQMILQENKSLRKQNANILKENQMIANIHQAQKDKELAKKKLIVEYKRILDQYIKELKKNYPDIQDIAISDEIKNNLNFSEVIHLIFRSGDQSIGCIAICQKKAIFNNIVNKVYEKNPKFKEYNDSFFLCKGMTISIYKTIEENKLKNGDVCVLYVNEDN